MLSLFLAVCLFQGPFLSPPVVRMLPAGEVQQVTGPTLKLPAEIRVKHGLALIVPLSSDCDDITWNILDDGIEPLPPGLIVPPGTFCVQTFEPGTYRVQAVGVSVVNGKAKATPFQTTSIIVGTPGPPIPPKPPDPPTPPEPTDPLFAKLKQAWAVDGKDVDALSKLRGVYVGAAPIFLDPTKSPNVKTCKNLVDLMHTAIVTQVGTRLPQIRMTIAAELESVLKTKENQPLDDALRAAHRTQFARIVALLEALR